MATRVLGKASYSAARIGGLTHVTAMGEAPNWNDKVDFDQLPFLIYPPRYAFYFIHEDVSLPTVRPFVHTEAIIFSEDYDHISIIDADGPHSVRISRLDLPPINAVAPDGVLNEFCVFAWIGINSMMIARCDAIVPAVYSRVFGPASHAACSAYIRENGGIA